MTEIPLMKPSITNREVQAVAQTVSSGWLSHHGEQVDKFEEEFAEYIGSEHAVTTASGTAGIRLVLEALGIGEGDEVIVPTLSYIATATPAVHAGADLKFVDVTSYFGMSLDRLEDAISYETEAVIVAHLFGMPARISDIVDLAESYDAKVIEDTAQALGATTQKGHAGTIGDVGIYSFTGSKILNTGQGGMVVTDSRRLADEMDHLKHHATVRSSEYANEYRHDQPAFNFCLTNMQAALGRVQLDRYDDMLRSRRDVGAHYYEEVEKRKGTVTSLDADRGSDNIEIYPKPDNTSAIWWHPVVEFDRREQRREAERRFEEQGIEVRRMFYPLPWQDALEVFTPAPGQGEHGYYSPPPGDWRAEQARLHYRKCLLLPCWPEMTVAQILRVVEVLFDE